MPLTRTAGDSVTAKLFKEAAVAPDKELLKNGNFDRAEGDALDGWSLRWSSAPGVHLNSSLTTFASTPAALELSLSSDAICAIEQVLPGEIAGKKIKVTGKLRAEGNFTELLLAVQCFDESKKQIAWINVLNGSKQVFGWKTFEKTMKIPVSCARPVLLIHANGTGRVWLDDASVLETER